MIATIWEVWNDLHGDFNKGADVFIRLIFLWIESFALHFIFNRHQFISFMLSTAIFFFFFDYIIAYKLIKNGTLEPPRNVTYHWFSYNAKVGAFDNLKFWRKSPKLRFIIKLTCLITAILIFIL